MNPGMLACRTNLLAYEAGLPLLPVAAAVYKINMVLRYSMQLAASWVLGRGS